METAIITGASRGLGLAVSRRLAAEGWTVVVDARDERALTDAAARIRREATGGAVVPVPGDIADPVHRRELAEAAAGTGRLDLLLNNAGGLGPSPQPALAEYPLAPLDDLFAVNVVGPLGIIQWCIPLLRRHQGTIVNVTSDAAVEAYEGWGGYGSTKAALEQLTRILAAEEPRIGVYAFDPGDMRTRMHQAAFPGEDISDRPDPATVAPALEKLVRFRPPSGRYRAADFAEAMAS